MGFFIDLKLIFGTSLTVEQAKILAKQLKRCDKCLGKLVPVSGVYRCAEACEESGDDYYYDSPEADEKTVTDKTEYPNLYFGSANAWDKCGGDFVLYVSMVNPETTNVTYSDLDKIYNKHREEFLRCLEFCGVNDVEPRVIATYNSST